jgi:hypothetical protein
LVGYKGVKIMIELKPVRFYISRWKRFWWDIEYDICYFFWRVKKSILRKKR